MKSRWAGFVMLGIGGAMVCAGVWRAEYMTVLRKAVTICLECIGIG